MMFGRRRVGSLIAGTAVQALGSQPPQTRAQSAWGQAGGETTQASGGGWGDQSGGSGWGEQATATGASGWGEQAAAGDASSGQWADASAGAAGGQQQTQGGFAGDLQGHEQDSTIVHTLYNWDHGDLYEYTIEYFRTIMQFAGKLASKESRVAKANIAVLTPRLSELTPNECAQIAVAGPWPEDWCMDPILGATFEVLRARIWAEAPGLEGDEAAHCFIAMNKPTNGLFKAIVKYHAEQEAAQKAQSSGLPAPAPGSTDIEGVQTMNLRLLRVIKHLINDVKQSDLILKLAVTSKEAHEANEMPIEFSAEWWPLLMRRFQAFEALKKINAHQSFSAIKTMFSMVSDKFDLTCLTYPMLFNVVAALNANEVEAAASVSDWDAASEKVVKFTKFNVDDFFEYLSKAAVFMSNNDFRAVNPLVGPLIKPCVEQTKDPKFISQHITMLNKSKNSNVQWLTAVCARVVEFEAAQANSFTFAEVALLLSLVARVPKTAAEDVAAHPQLHGFIQMGLAKVVAACEDMDQAKTLFFADVMTSLLATFGGAVKHLEGPGKNAESEGAIKRIKHLVIEPVEVVLVDYFALRMVKNIWTSTFKEAGINKFLKAVNANADLIYLNQQGAMPQLIKTMKGLRAFNEAVSKKDSDEDEAKAKKSGGKAKAAAGTKDLKPMPEGVGAKSILFLRSNEALSMHLHLQKPHHWLATSGKQFDENKLQQLKTVIAEKDSSLGHVESLGALILRYALSTDLAGECPRVLTVTPRNEDGMSGAIPTRGPTDGEIAKVVVALAGEKAPELVQHLNAGGTKASNARNAAKKYCTYLKNITSYDTFNDSPLKAAVEGNAGLNKVWKDLRAKLGDGKLSSIEWDTVTEGSVAMAFTGIDPNAVPEVLEPVTPAGAAVDPAAAAAAAAQAAGGWDQSQQVAGGGWGGQQAADPNAAQAGQGWGGQGAADPNAQAAGGWGGQQQAQQGGGGWGGQAADPNAQAAGGGWGGQQQVDPNAQAGGGWGGQQADPNAQAGGGGWGGQQQADPNAGAAGGWGGGGGGGWGQ